jgi:hypothetical protein
MSSTKERLDAIEERLDKIRFIIARLGNDLSQAESDVYTALYVQRKCKHCPKVGRLVY